MGLTACSEPAVGRASGRRSESQRR